MSLKSSFDPFSHETILLSDLLFEVRTHEQRRKIKQSRHMVSKPYTLSLVHTGNIQ